MAIVTDGTEINLSISTGLHIDENADAPVQPNLATDRKDPDRTSVLGTADIEDPGSENDPDRAESDRSEEVPSLLGKIVIADDQELGNVPGQVAAGEDTISQDDVIDEGDADKPAFAPGSFPGQSDNRPQPTIIAERGNDGEELRDPGGELKYIMESLQDSLANTQYISLKIDTVSNDTASLIKQVNTISLNYELLTAEIESISSDANAKSMLSKTFLIISSLVLAVLVVIQIYMFLSLNKIQRLQNSAGSSVLEQIGTLNKKMADYDKNLTKALEKPVQQEHTQPNPAVAEKTDLNVHENSNMSSAHAAPVNERLNKLRNGLPEKKVIRKETGDWFVYNKKNDECISDVEVIQALNEAYRKIGRTISTHIPLPPINALCILKPDGKGGTEIVMTEKFVP